MNKIFGKGTFENPWRKKNLCPFTKDDCDINTGWFLEKDELFYLENDNLHSTTGPASYLLTTKKFTLKNYKTIFKTAHPNYAINNNTMKYDNWRALSRKIKLDAI